MHFLINMIFFYNNINVKRVLRLTFGWVILVLGKHNNILLLLLR